MNSIENINYYEKERLFKLREQFLKFMTSVEEIDGLYPKNIVEFILQDEFISNIITMKNEISKISHWYDMTMADDKNVIATFDYSKKLQMMRHFRLNEDNKLQLINAWQVKNHHFSGSKQIIRDANLYLVTEGAYTTRAYDYKNCNFFELQDNGIVLTINDAYDILSKINGNLEIESVKTLVKK